MVLAANSSTNATCEDLLSQNAAITRQQILEASLASAEKWADTTAAISVTSLVLDVVMLALLFHFRRHRPVQRAGLSFLACLLVGCMFGHIASLMDGQEPTGSLCRGRLAIIYLFLYGLLAPLVGKLASLLRAARNVLLAGNASGWDSYAKRVTAAILALELLAIVFYLGISAGKPSREDRLQTVCSEQVSEHAFHFFDGFCMLILLILCFGMVAWLQMSTFSAKRGIKDLLLCTLAVAGGSFGLLSLLATSTIDLSWASAVVPVRLLIVLLVAWIVVGFQVFPPLFLTLRDLLERRLHPHGRRQINRMGEDATAKLVAVQQKQLLELEAEVVERQRALQENLLRLKLMKEPILQAWAEVRTVPISAAAAAPPSSSPADASGRSVGRSASHRQTNFLPLRRGSSGFSNIAGSTMVVVGDSGGGGGGGGWTRYYCRLYQNKKLVCWSDASEQQRNMPPAMVVDLFDVIEGQQVVEESEVARPTSSLRAELQLVKKTEAVQVRFLDGRPSGSIRDPSTAVAARGRGGRAAERAAERARLWLGTLQHMLREITEPDAPPAFQNVKLWVGTWNMGNTPPEAEQLGKWLGVDVEKHDVYAVGLQESTFALSKEQRQVSPTLNAFMSTLLVEVLGSEYRVVEVRAMWEIRLLVLAHEDILPHLEVLDSASEPTGLGGVGGNKGGVAAALALHRSTTLCFVTAHLAAHQHMTTRRNRDCVDIFKGMRSLGTSKRPGKRTLDPSVGFDHCFFFGDLNYRIAAPVETVLDTLEDEGGFSANKLHACDQLREEMSQRRALCGFTETPPEFKPTFKRLKLKARGELLGGGLEEDGSRYSTSEVSEGMGRAGLHAHLQKGAGPAGKGHKAKRISTMRMPSGFSSAIKAMKPSRAPDFVAGPAASGGAPPPLAHAGSSGALLDAIPDEGEEGEEAVDDATSMRTVELKKSLSREIHMLGQRPSPTRASSYERDDDEGEPPADLHARVLERAARLSYNAQRIPSWCDRVLWRSYPMCGCEQTKYSSVEEVTTSDHTPVAATFSVRVMLPADAECKATGDLYQWELSVASVELLVPLAALDDEDAAAARTATPEISVEFCGTIIRTGYTTPPLKATLLRDVKDDSSRGDLRDIACPPWAEGAALSASFRPANGAMLIQLTDNAQQLGPQRIALSHLIFQVVADFGHRRVVLGATVLPLDSPLNDPGTHKQLALYNCGVDGGAVLSVEATLRDLGSRHNLLASTGPSRVRSSVDQALSKVRGGRGKSLDALSEGERSRSSLANTALGSLAHSGGALSRWKIGRKKVKALLSEKRESEQARLEDGLASGGPEDSLESGRALSGSVERPLGTLSEVQALGGSAASTEWGSCAALPMVVTGEHDASGLRLATQEMRSSHL